MKIILFTLFFFNLLALYMLFPIPLTTFFPLVVLLFQNKSKFFSLTLVFLLGMFLNLIEIDIPFGFFPFCYLMIGLILIWMQNKIQINTLNLSILTLSSSLAIQLFTFFVKTNPPFILTFILQLSIVLAIDFVLGFLFFWTFDILKIKSKSLKVKRV